MKAQAERNFPKELLRATQEERVAHFKNRKVEHMGLQSVFEQATRALTRFSGPRVVMVTGPTGVGKTTMARGIYRQVMRANEEEARNDSSFVPAIGINAIPPNGVNFSWKDFYIRLLERNGDILIDRKLLVPRQNELFPERPVTSYLERSVSDALRRSVENCIRLRKTKVLLIDEAHHLLMVKDPARLEYQFEALKSLTIETDVIIVLVGTYRLLDIRDQSGQLVRRSEIIHFPRYDMRNEADAAEFCAVLANFVSQLPLDEPPDVLREWEYFYLKTAGCIGILKDWLTKCLDEALSAGLKTFDTDFASRFAMSNRCLETIAEEALIGEAKLKDVSLDSLKSLLANGFGPTQERPTGNGVSGGRRRVGERNPVRDRTGGSHVSP